MDYGLNLSRQPDFDDDPSGGRKQRSGLISLIVHAAAITALLIGPKFIKSDVIDLNTVGGHKSQSVMYLEDAPIQPRPEMKPPTLSKKDLDAMRAELKLPTPPPPKPATPEPPTPTPTPTPAPAAPPTPKQLPTAPQAPVTTQPQGNPGGQLPSAPPTPTAGAGDIKTSEAKTGEVKLENPKLPVLPASPGGNNSLEDTVRGIAKSRATGQGGIDVPIPGFGGRSASGPGQITGAQIMSDTQGIDFNPYLQRVVFEIRRNWISVMPEIARMGKRGKVVLQFEILKDGVVPKIYLINSSQSEPLDRAAYAGISASSPFPPLPAEFKGPLLRLQLGFLYNIPLQ